jgi:Tol biopolymer transport system component
MKNSVAIHHVILVFLFLHQAIAFSQENTPDANTLLLLHMNESSGSSVIDSSGNGNNGTATGTSIVSGLFGNARSFNGTSSDYIAVPNSSTLSLPVSFTVEAWIRIPRIPSDYKAIIAKREDHVGSWTENYGLYVTPSGTIRFQFTQNSINGFLDSQTGVGDGNWHHVAGTYDGSVMKVYVDRNLSGSMSRSRGPDVNSMSITIGRIQVAYFLEGTIDEVRLSNVARLFSNDVILFESNRSGLSTIWRVNPDGTGLQMVSPSNITISEGTPAPSPDGSYIVFYRYDAGLWKMGFNGSGRIQVAANGGASSGTTWAPTGEILYQNVSACSESIYGIRPDGTGQRLVVQPGIDITEGTAQFPSWSTTNKISVIGRNCGSATGRLYTLNPDRTGIQMILGGAEYAEWSPDGSKLAVQRFDAAKGSYHIWVINADGSNPIRLTTTENNGSPNWSPSGAQIVFRRGPVGSPNGNIWIMNADGSNMRQVTTGDFSEAKPVWIQLGMQHTFEYVLKRQLTSSSTEVYRLDNHAWSFGNSDGIDLSTNPPNLTNAIMWPRTWWTQFDYSQSPYPLGWPYWPINASSADFPDWPLYVQAFGENQCYLDPPPGLIVYSPIAVSHWRSIVASARYYDSISHQLVYSWSGSCFGFAISNFLLFDNLRNVSTVFPGYSKVHDVTLHDESRKFINLYWIYQWGRDQLSYVESILNSKTPIATLEEIKAMFISSNRNDRVLSLRNQNGSGGHTVNPYRVTVGTTVDTIYIYDNNAPNELRWILVNKSSNTWDYPFPPMQRWGGSRGLFLRDPVSDYVTNAGLPKTSLELAHHISVSSDSTRFMEVFSNFNCDVVLKNTKIDSIGYKGGKTFSTLTRGMPIVPETGSEHPPVGYYLPAESYSVQLSNFADTTTYLSVFSDSAALSIRRSGTRRTDIDRVIFQNGSKALSLTNNDSSAKTFNAELIVAAPGNQKVFQVDDLRAVSGDSVSFHIEENKDLQIVNIGEAKKYNLFVRLASLGRDQIFEHQNIDLSRSSGQKIQPTWDSLSTKPLVILVDKNNSGVWDDTLRLQNQHVSDIEEPHSIPTSFTLAQNYPNPFNSTSMIRYTLAKESYVVLKVYDVLGREVRTLVRQRQVAGQYTVIFDASELSSGVYFCRLNAGTFVGTKKMLLMR